MSELRAQILNAFGVTEEEATVGFEDEDAARADAKAEREWFERVEIPRRIEGALEQLNRRLADELGTDKFRISYE